MRGELLGTTLGPPREFHASATRHLAETSSPAELEVETLEFFLSTVLHDRPELHPVYDNYVAPTTDRQHV